MNEPVQGGNLYNKYETKNPVTVLIMKRFLRTLDSLLQEGAPKSVLDVGCGEGYLIKHLRQTRGISNIRGIDLSVDVLEEARAMNLGVEIRHGSIYSIPYGDKSFDLVLASEVLEHLNDPDSGIRELKRVSRKHVLVTVPNEPYFRIANILRLSSLSRCGNTPGHLQNWTKKEFRKLLSKHFDSFRLKCSTLWQLALCDVLA